MGAVVLSAVHYVYIIGIIAIIGFMLLKKDTTIICILGIFAVGFAATTSFAAAVGGIFDCFIVSINELAGTILIISVITALCRILEITGINEKMVSPITRLIKNPSSAYWIIGIVMLIISTFFWPSPAVALIGAVFLPVAIKAKLPAIGVAMAMNLFGHGIALSGDFVIQGAPKLAADGAGIELSEQISASIPLVAVMGVVTTVLAYIFLMKDIRSGRLQSYEPVNEPIKIVDSKIEMLLLSSKLVNLFAIFVPLCFMFNVFVMVVANLQGGDATALIGGTALLLLVIITFFAFKQNAFDEVTSVIVNGFTFGFSVFGPVIPIAAFFYLGDSALTAVFGEASLPVGSFGLVNDIGMALSEVVPINKGSAAFSSTLMGIITGLDGSGFSGINLAGSVAKIFAIALGHGAATLSVLGQIGAIWVGGGTIIPWAVIPVAAICGVKPIDLVARNLKPVAIGLVVTTIVGIFLMGNSV